MSLTTLAWINVNAIIKISVNVTKKCYRCVLATILRIKALLYSKSNDYFWPIGLLITSTWHSHVKKWANPGLFLFIFILFSLIIQIVKLRWCAWDSNPRLHNGRHRQNHVLWRPPVAWLGLNLFITSDLSQFWCIWPYWCLPT